jgi:hypothetical protein
LEFFNTEPPLVKVFDSTGTAYTNSGTVSVYPANNFMGLSGDGDNLLAYLGPQNLTPSTFLAGLVFNGIGWGNGAGDLPTALAGGNYSLSFSVSFTGGIYDCTKGNDGSQAALLAVINNTANWNALPNAQNTDLPFNQAISQPYGPYWDADSCSFTVNALHTTPTPHPTWTPQATPTPIPTNIAVNLSAGSVAFVSLAARSTIADQFAVVFLADIPQGTTLGFTDDNWSNTSAQFMTIENVIYWKADKQYYAGEILQILNTDPYQAEVFTKDGTGTVDGSGTVWANVAGSSFGLDKGGDNLFVFQGDLNNNPTFITGLAYKVNWGTWATPAPTATPSAGDLPSALTLGTNAFYLGSKSFGYYDRTQGTYGTATSLDTKINNASKWTGKVDTSDTDLAVPVQPAITATWAVTP